MPARNTSRAKPAARQQPGGRTRRRASTTRSEQRLGASEAAAPRHEATTFGTLVRRVNWSKVVAGGLLIGSFWLLITFFAGARFRVEDIRVSGMDLVTPDEIISTSGLLNTSIFRVRQDQLARRLQAEYGFIDSVAVHCVMPNTVRVEVEEHGAVIVWESGGQYWWVDTAGRVLGGDAHPDDLLVIHDVGSSNMFPENYVIGVPWRLAIEISRQLPGAHSFDYTVEQGLVLYVTERQWPVYLGHQGDAVTKVALLRELVNQLSAKGATVRYIDLRNESRPIYCYS